MYGLPALSVPASSSSGLAVLFLLHGRGEDSQIGYITQLATKLVESARDKRAHVSPIGAAGAATTKRAKDLLVVTFDQRNHGHRLVDPERNMSWMEAGRRRAKVRQERGMAPHDLDNENHAFDMFAMQSESSQTGYFCSIGAAAASADAMRLLTSNDRTHSWHGPRRLLSDRLSRAFLVPPRRAHHYRLVLRRNLPRRTRDVARSRSWCVPPSHFSTEPFFSPC